MLYTHPEALAAQLLERFPARDFFLLADTNTQRDCWPLLEPFLPIAPERVLAIPAGEPHKTLETCGLVWNWLLEQRADRRAVLLNLGGGVVGDLGGFCAATYKRGIAFAQLPTSLLAQVDASVGGKLGIDFGGVKNSLGAFRNPDWVGICAGFLPTLPVREWGCGLGEIIKHACLGAGASAQWLDALPDTDSLRAWPLEQILELVADSVRFKQQVVEADFEERGLRQTLNLGHTIGHAVESASWASPYALLHGEAVGFGLWAEAHLAAQVLGLPANDTARVQAWVDRFFGKNEALRGWAHTELDRTRIAQGLAQDKKNERGGIRFALLERIGQARWAVEAPESAVWDSIEAARRHFQGG